ncbi:uncharacterized protein DS421_1g29160 [Arachis hypogaea]|nr:uncharacterized protein DS421_1g29160 [Arachis hypogaea]
MFNSNSTSTCVSNANPLPVPTAVIINFMIDATENSTSGQETNTNGLTITHNSGSHIDNITNEDCRLPTTSSSSPSPQIATGQSDYPAKPPPSAIIIGCKWVYAIKKSSNGEILRGEGRERGKGKGRGRRGRGRGEGTAPTKFGAAITVPKERRKERGCDRGEEKRGKREGAPVDGRTVNACFCRHGVRRRKEEPDARRAAREGERGGSEAELVHTCSVAGPQVMGGRGERGIRGWSASPVLARSVATAGDGWPSAGGSASASSSESASFSASSSASALHLLLLLLHLLLLEFLLLFL